MRWRREEAALRSAKALKGSTDELLEFTEAWTAAKGLGAFFADAECQAQELADE